MADQFDESDELELLRDIARSLSGIDGSLADLVRVALDTQKDDYMVRVSVVDFERDAHSSLIAAGSEAGGS